MRETKIYCDHCKKELDQMHDYTDLHMDFGVDFADVDLCKKCYGELVLMANKYCNTHMKGGEEK